MSINARAVNAVVNLNLAACFGGITWAATDMLRNCSRRISLNSFCCGAIAGLVTITPASGFVRPHFAIVFGFFGKKIKSTNNQSF
jgi:ammonium transporter, Amt family